MKDIGIWITGGGTMGGRAAMGMFQYLEEIGLYPDRIKVVGGVSLGALCLMGVAANMNAQEMSEFSLKLDSRFQFTPNTKTKVGISDINPGIAYLRKYLFSGGNPDLDDSNIPIVLGGTNIETGQPYYFCDDYPLLDALKHSLSNPFIFPIERNSQGVVGDGGMSCPVGVDFLRQKYDLKKVILFDVQTANKHQIAYDLKQPLGPFGKSLINIAKALTKLPIAGKKLKQRHLPWLISCLVHAAPTLRLLGRSSNILLSKLVDEQIKNQKPDVVIRLEDAVDSMEDQSYRAYEEENGRVQIASGYKAAKLVEKQLKSL